MIMGITRINNITEFFGEKTPFATFENQYEYNISNSKTGCLFIFSGGNRCYRNSSERKNTGCNNLDHIEVLRQEIDYKKSLDNKIEALRRERYENGKNNGKMDDI